MTVDMDMITQVKRYIDTEDGKYTRDEAWVRGCYENFLEGTEHPTIKDLWMLSMQKVKTIDRFAKAIQGLVAKGRLEYIEC